MKKLLIILCIIGVSFSCTPYTCPTYASTDEIEIEVEDETELKPTISMLDWVIGYLIVTALFIAADNN